MFYLKFRPQKVKELDLEPIRQKMAEILTAERLPHAFLFAGPKGTGKTSAARILAKAVNCLTKGGFEPCNRCSICRSITGGTALDLIEVDAASNRGIDDVRNLREKVKLVPSEAKYKVYVIDEAHMLTREAFNALLKTLEEPPEHAIFVLCTTEPEKLPETIVSRCLHLQFRRGSPAEVRRSLERVVRAEKIKIEPEAVGLIAENSEGSFRDAQKVLEQLVMKKKKITQKMVKEEMGRSEEAAVEKFLELLFKKEAKGAIEEINRQVKQGLNLGEFTNLILEKLRLLLLGAVGLHFEDEVVGVNLPFSKEEIIQLIELFETASRTLKSAVIPQLPLEMAVAKWGLENIKTQEHKNTRTKKHKSIKPQRRKSNKGLDLKEIEERWEEILKGVKPLNHSVEALLRSAKPLSLHGKILTLEVFYPFHQERLNTEKNRRLIEEVISKVIRKEVGVKCVLGNKKS